MKIIKLITIIFILILSNNHAQEYVSYLQNGSLFIYDLHEGKYYKSPDSLCIYNYLITENNIFVLIDKKENYKIDFGYYLLEDVIYNNMFTYEKIDEMKSDYAYLYLSPDSTRLLLEYLVQDSMKRLSYQNKVLTIQNKSYVTIPELIVNALNWIDKNTLIYYEKDVFYIFDIRERKNHVIPITRSTNISPQLNIKWLNDTSSIILYINGKVTSLLYYQNKSLKEIYKDSAFTCDGMILNSNIFLLQRTIVSEPTFLKEIDINGTVVNNINLSKIFQTNQKYQRFGIGNNSIDNKIILMVEDYDQLHGLYEMNLKNNSYHELHIPSIINIYNINLFKYAK